MHPMSSLAPVAALRLHACVGTNTLLYRTIQMQLLSHSDHPLPPPARCSRHLPVSCEHVTLKMLTQRTAARRNFNFDADDRWQSYRQRLELPAGSDEAVVLQRMKRKWYRREIDPTIDAQGPSLHRAWLLNTRHRA